MNNQDMYLIDRARPERHLLLTSPIGPSVNHYLSYRAVIKHGKPMAMSYCTKEAKQYKEWLSNYVTDEVMKQNWDLVPNKFQHFYVDCVFYFPALRLDCNNYFKCMLDAITDTQKVWLDDNVVCERVQAIYYDSENPRIEIDIHPVDYIGIFNNMSHYEEFSSKCIECTRHSRNCSILQKAVEGRLQPEICDGVCSRYKGKKNVDRR